MKLEGKNSAQLSAGSRCDPNGTGPSFSQLAPSHMAVLYYINLFIRMQPHPCGQLLSSGAEVLFLPGFGLLESWVTIDLDNVLSLCLQPETGREMKKAGVRFPLSS